VPPFTTSVDAGIPGENIVLVRFVEWSRKWIAIAKAPDGALLIGVGNTEPLARRIAGLKNLRRQRAGVQQAITDGDLKHLQSLVLELIAHVRACNDYPEIDPVGKLRRLRQLEQAAETLHSAEHDSLSLADLLLPSLIFFAGAFAEGIIVKLAEETLTALERLLGG
jgi:hypothetical protein